MKHKKLASIISLFLVLLLILPFSARAVTQSDWIVLGVCFAVLLGGILFSKRYSGKR